MAEFYIHKIGGGCIVLKNDKALSAKGKTTGKPAVFKSVSAAHEFIKKINRSENETDVEPKKD